MVRVRVRVKVKIMTPRLCVECLSRVTVREACRMSCEGMG